VEAPVAVAVVFIEGPSCRRTRRSWAIKSVRSVPGEGGSGLDVSEGAGVPAVSRTAFGIRAKSQPYAPATTLAKRSPGVAKATVVASGRGKAVPPDLAPGAGHGSW
jgi:hypothetical protein